MDTASKFQIVLFDFVRQCFDGQGTSGPPKYSQQDGLFARLSDGDLTVSSVRNLNPVHRDLLRELLIQYLMALQINQLDSFPDNLLVGSDGTRLDRGMLDYFCLRRWPMPQLVKQVGRPDA